MIILAIQYSVDWWRSIVVALEVFFTLTHSTISTATRWNQELILVVLIDKKMLEAGADGLHHQTCPTSALLLYYISISLSPSDLPPSTETFFAATSSLFYAQRYFSFIFIEKVKYKKILIRERWKNRNQIRRKETREKTELQVKFEKNSKFS